MDLAEQLWIRVNAAASGQDIEAIRALQRLRQLPSPPPSQPAQNSGKGFKPPITPKPSTTPPRLNLSRRRVIQTVGFIGGGLGLAIVVPRLLQPNSGESSTSDTTTTTPAKPENPVISSPTSQNRLKTFPFEVVKVDAQGNITNRSESEAKYFVEDLGDSVTLEMVQIPGGTFMMGSPAGEKERESDEGPQHQVKVAGFFMGKYEITQAQYQAIMGSNPSNFKTNGGNQPVEQVNWNDAVEFCKKLSKKTGRTYRLPSEAEWEYACRAGTTTPFYFGETITTDLANYDGNYTYASAPQGQYRNKTTKVGSFPPNAFGLYDMHGNVWEWCQDYQNNNYQGAPTDGSAWLSSGDIFTWLLDGSNSRLLRGGSWNYNPWNCRSADRYGNATVTRFLNIGFRVVGVVA
ncbi:MAG: formylglycine-generating enzyme family protein [Komarekiella atlantica HA4396-MV6]|nr:formylglycine-generating enzyme family protein [Komarekiella atlantica HA4396-MV6]